MSKKNNISNRDLKIFNKALGFQNNGNFEKAIVIYNQLFTIYPSIFEIKINLGVCYFGLNNFKQAAIVFHKLHEDYSDNTTILNYCAVTYLKLGNNNLALDFLKRLVHYEPDNVEAWVNLTYAANLLNKHTDSLYFATQALSLNPKETKLYNNMGSALQTVHRYKDAMICYETALELDSNNINALTNIATILDKQSLYSEAIAKYEQALDSKFINNEEKNEIQYRMSFPLLGSGSLELGWHYYNKGFQISGDRGRTPNRKFQVPLWQGENIKDKKLLIWREQGLGDEVWFFSLIEEAFKYCNNIIIECSERLISLVQRAYPKCIVRKEMSPLENSEHCDFDFHIPAGSLCGLFRSSWSHFPPNAGYLVAKRDLVEKFNSKLSIMNSKLLVGLSWRSGNLLTTRNIHYAPISDWEPILKIPNIQFVNLQYGDCTEELNNVRNYYGVEILNFEDVNLKDDLESVAAIISNLDLVISVGTFVSPFSQALGIPVKLITHKNWTMLGKNIWPWSKNVELYCPENLELPISTVFDQVASDLRNMNKHYKLNKFSNYSSVLINKLLKNV